MSLAKIVLNGRGTAGHWRVTPAESVPGSNDLDCAALWHYSTVMLVWRASDNRVLYLSTGHGSVSDQNGVNTALKLLGGWKLHYGRPVPVPGTSGPAFYFSRAGGATYHVLDSRYTLIPTRGGAFQPMLAALASEAS